MNIIVRIIRKIYIRIHITYLNHFFKNISIGAGMNYRGKLILNCTDIGHIIIGDGVFFNNGCTLNAKHSIKIGDNCIFGESVKIYDHNHRFNQKNTLIKDQGYSVKPVSIGNNCWIGSNTVVLAGTIIGDNTVISAGCIVRGIIPENVIVKHSNNLNIESIKFCEERIS